MLLAAGLNVRGRWLAAGAGFTAAGLVLLAILPADWQVLTRDPNNGQERLTVNSLAVGTLSILTLTLAAFACAKLRRTADGRMLAGWLLIEIVGYFALSPFSAVRRLIGVVFVLTLIAGRLAVAAPRRTADAVVAFGVLLGGGYATLDWADAYAEKDAAADIAAWIAPQRSTDETVWFCGHWGFQHYACRAGMVPVFPDETVVREGDWVVVPAGDRPYAQRIVLSPEDAEAVWRYEWFLRLPLRTMSDYYGTSMAVRRHEGPR